MNKIWLLILILLFGCSDYTEDLGCGYFFRNEGIDIKDILCRNEHGAEIPSTIVEYRFDKEYIVAKQKPKIPQEPLYKYKYEYAEGNDCYYYWVITKRNNEAYGPLNEKDYRAICENLKIPKIIIVP